MIEWATYGHYPKIMFHIHMKYTDTPSDVQQMAPYTQTCSGWRKQGHTHCTHQPSTSMWK